MNHPPRSSRIRATPRAKLAFAWASVLMLASPLTSAAIVDYGTYTEDTATGLRWLDVDITRGFSANQLAVELQEGGQLAGWRYATVEEFDQLMLNLGFSPSPSPCPRGGLFCQTLPDPDGTQIEDAIRLLGDVLDAKLDGRPSTLATFLDGEQPDADDISEQGAGYTFGLLARTATVEPDSHPVALIWDEELVRRVFRESDERPDYDDQIWTVYTEQQVTVGQANVGHFLVSPVPLPAAVWMFGGALAGLMWLRRR